MSRTVDLSLSTRTQQFLVLALLVGSLVVPVLTAVLSAVGLTVPQAFAGAAAAWLALAVLWVRRSGGAENDGGAWDGIPRRQYEGRFAEAGGLTRSEQEDALEQVGDE